MKEMKNKKAIKYIENKQQTDRGESLLTSNLHLNGLNSPIKRQRLIKWIKTHGPTTCSIQNLILGPKIQIN